MLTRTQAEPSENKKKQCFDLVMAFTTVALFYFAFPSGGLGDLAWLTLVPVVIALNNSSGRNAFFLGLLAATLGWMCSIWWAINGISEITSTQANLVIPFVFIFCFLSALPYAIACWFHVRLKSGYSVVGALSSAVIFTVLVNYIPHILPGNLAHALYKRPLFIQLADVGGVPLVFYIIHCINFLLANAITLVKTNRRQSQGCLLLAITLFFANIAYGDYRLSQSQVFDGKAGKTLHIAMLQPNIDIKNRTRNDWKTQQTLLTPVLDTLEQNQNVDLVVFPEVPVPISYQYYPEDKLYFEKHLPSKTLLMTTIKPANNHFESDINENGSYFNTMELIAHKRVTQEYSKQVLLPFGEYIPFQKSMPWLKDLFPYAPNYKPGNQSTLLTIKNNDNVIHVIPLICYEAVFTEIVGNGVKKGGEILINSSNDDWFAHIAGKNTHYALALFRTIEFRKYLVRTTNTGVSGIITPYGRLLDSSKIDDNILGYSINEIEIQPITSFYSQYPNLIKYLFMSLALVIVLFGRKSNVRN
ncbi:apolipoprotein N-acyltransferase [Colwellia sp. MSW7]|uniref:Apolipoprotein N-acyltransferase n=1 Tax=Colwellia maritima TaxID=2912588 RepID=A0ABS9WXK5_9GAMM|nr:apolipoprotein N-acyltransferase [Colwellia maritima]